MPLGRPIVSAASKGCRHVIWHDGLTRPERSTTIERKEVAFMGRLLVTWHQTCSRQHNHNVSTCETFFLSVYRNIRKYRMRQVYTSWYSGDCGSKYQSRPRLSWLKYFFVVFLRAFMKVPRCYLKIRYESVHILSISSFICYQTIWSYRTYTALEMSLNELNTNQSINQDQGSIQDKWHWHDVCPVSCCIIH